ncbi:MAG TPA: hypothetical protein VGB00_06770 [Pyrinomonadaceae bacterium]|jgi:hypothetical protein
MRKRLTEILLLFVGLNLLLSGCVEQRRKFIHPIPFEKQKWLGLDDDGISDAEMRWKYRPGMAKYLIDKEILIGKSRPELLAMLGEYVDDSLADSKKEIKYELEQIYGSNIDPIAIESLKITFDSVDKVEKAEIEFYKTGDWSTF